MLNLHVWSPALTCTLAPQACTVGSICALCFAQRHMDRAAWERTSMCSNAAWSAASGGIPIVYFCPETWRKMVRDGGSSGTARVTTWLMIQCLKFHSSLGIDHLGIWDNLSQGGHVCAEFAGLGWWLSINLMHLRAKPQILAGIDKQNQFNGHSRSLGQYLIWSENTNETGLDLQWILRAK